MRLTFTLQSSYTGAQYVAGPFNISGTTEAGTTYLLASGVTKSQLSTGHSVNTVYETLTGGTINSTGTCTTSRNWYVVSPVSTLSYTMTGPTYYFYLSNPLASDITINMATVGLHNTTDCNTVNDDANLDSPVTISAGTTSAQQTTTGNSFFGVTYIKPYNQITLTTYGSKVDGGTFTVGPTVVTVDLDPTCQPFAS
jgi:hypothetical protein